jgi:phospholipid/cholesterol/gamma-HCH transport system substrate-binding protein
VYFKIETLVGAFILLALSLFVYMSFQLGSVRLNLARYATYTVSFNDVASLLPKADIKISGVKVGWVESIFLDPADMRVKVTIKVLKDYRLYKDSKVLVRQEGLLGVKYLELIPGTLEAGVIPAGGMLGYQEQSQRGLDELFTTVTTLAKQIERLGTSLEESTKEAREVLKEIQKRLSTIDRVFEGVEDTSAIFQETAAAVKQAGERVGELLKFDDVAVADAQSVVKKLTQGKGSLTKLLLMINFMLTLNVLQIMHEVALKVYVV